MDYAGTITIVFLMILLTILPGCDSKKKNVAQTTPQNVNQTQPLQKAGDVKATFQDEAEASAARTRVLTQIKRGDFNTIYEEASAGFKDVGHKQQFLALWNKQLQETGAFKEAKEISHTVRPADKFLVYTYNVKYEKKPKELRLTFGRTKNGKMELTGINQTDLK
jgi:hypothetical protein